MDAPKVSQLTAAFESGNSGGNDYGSPSQNRSYSPGGRGGASQQKVPTFLAFVAGDRKNENGTNPIDVNKMESIRNSGASADSYVYAGNAGGETTKSAKTLTTIAPGVHPWIALGSPGRTMEGSTTKKKIVIPPPSAY
eukprot:TRINITY_DN587_c0_g1_i1.p1 TRINITY_DN587_c0_g1~~TRINITY_DN587_c0_g1_i1.p1  ORF type:complete len:138 (-),score=35.65 TRINITY_DN587_c0_g1_i1:56-469(-)